MIVTNNEDFYQYITNRGVMCTYLKKPVKIDDALFVVFPETHNMTTCGNRFNKEKENDYRLECEQLIDWMECDNRVIVVTPVIKFDSEYMKRVAPNQYERLQAINYHKQVIHTRDIGELLVPHKLVLRYVGVEPVEFDKVDCCNIIDPKYRWLVNDNVFKPKSCQTHYINVLNASHDTMTRRKLRYIPEYALFSQLYNKLNL